MICLSKFKSAFTVMLKMGKPNYENGQSKFGLFCKDVLATKVKCTLEMATRSRVART